jgi:hypothetical protein
MDPTEALLASLGVSGSPKPVKQESLPPYACVLTKRINPHKRSNPKLQWEVNRTNKTLASTSKCLHIVNGLAHEQHPTVILLSAMLNGILLQTHHRESHSGTPANTPQGQPTMERNCKYTSKSVSMGSTYKHPIWSTDKYSIWNWPAMARQDHLRTNRMATVNMDLIQTLPTEIDLALTLHP